MTEKKPHKRSGLFEPVFALVGATELATNVLRELGSDKERAELVADEPAAKPSMIARLRGDVTDIARGTTRVPGLAAEELRTRYTELAERGQQTITSAVPVVKKARRDGEDTVKAEEAKARREARRLARQAGATVTRGRTMAASAADDAAKVAERTFEAVRTEAGQVVDSVTRPGRIKSYSPRDAAARRRSAVTDTAVTSTSPIGGDPSSKTELAGAGGVEAAAATIGRRRARKNATPATDEDRPASRPTLTRRAAAQSGSTTPDPTTVVAKKARARAAAEVADEGSEKVWTSESPSLAAEKADQARPTDKAENTDEPVKQERTDTSERTEDTQQSNDSSNDKHSDIPTPAEVAKVIEGSHDEA